MTWAAPADDVHREQLRALESRDVPPTHHAGEALLCDLHGKRLYLAGPEGLDAKPLRGQGEAPDAIKEAPHGQGLHLLTAAAMDLVVLTAVWAV